MRGGRIDVERAEHDAAAAGRPGTGAHAIRPVTIARPRTGTCGSSGESGPTASSRSGIAISDASGTTRSPTASSGAQWRSPTALTVPARMPPEPVHGFWSLPRSATMPAIAASMRAGSPSLRSRIAR